MMQEAGLVLMIISGAVLILRLSWLQWGAPSQDFHGSE